MTSVSDTQGLVSLEHWMQIFVKLLIADIDFTFVTSYNEATRIV